MNIKMNIHFCFVFGQKCKNYYINMFAKIKTCHYPKTGDFMHLKIFIFIWL